MEPARRPAARLLFDGLRRGLAHQPALRQVPRTVLATGLHEPRPVDRRASPAPAGKLGHAPRRVPLHGRRRAVRREDRRGEGPRPAALPHAGRHRRQGSERAQAGARGLGLGNGGRRQGGVPSRSGPRRAARGAEGRVPDGAGLRRPGKRVRRAGGCRRALVPARLDGARRQAPHLDRRGHQRVPLALRPAGRGRRVLSARARGGQVAVRTRRERRGRARRAPAGASAPACRRSAS